MDVWERMRSVDDKGWRIHFVDGTTRTLRGHFEFDPLGRPLYLKSSTGEIWLYQAMIMVVLWNE